MVQINEVADNIFVLVDQQANIFIFTSDLNLLARSQLRISDPSIVRFSKTKNLLGIASETDRNIIVFDIRLCLAQMPEVKVYP